MIAKVSVIIETTNLFSESLHFKLVLDLFLLFTAYLRTILFLKRIYWCGTTGITYATANGKAITVHFSCTVWFAWPGHAFIIRPKSHATKWNFERKLAWYPNLPDKTKKWFPIQSQTCIIWKVIGLKLRCVKYNRARPIITAWEGTSWKLMKRMC